MECNRAKNQLTHTLQFCSAVNICQILFLDPGQYKNTVFFNSLLHKQSAGELWCNVDKMDKKSCGHKQCSQKDCIAVCTKKEKNHTHIETDDKDE